MSEEKTKEPLGEFLHPKSMLTPGICGALVMAITNALGQTFSMDDPTRGWVCLGLSFLAGALVFVAGVKKLVPRLAYYVFNSLIIFSTAAGVNYSGQVATGGAPPSGVSAAPVVVTNTLVQTQIVVQVVRNGQTNVSSPRPAPPVLLTNRVSSAVQAVKREPKFFQPWR